MRKRKKIKLQQESEQHLTNEALIQDDDNEILSGLYLFGKVFDCSKRTIPQSSTEVVIYIIQYNVERHYYVDEYSPQTILNVVKTSKFLCTSRYSKNAMVKSATASMSNNNKSIPVESNFEHAPSGA